MLQRPQREPRKRLHARSRNFLWFGQRQEGKNLMDSPHFLVDYCRKTQRHRPTQEYATERKGNIMAAKMMARTVQALKYVFYANMTPYAAAIKAQINLATMYKNPLYKRWRDGDAEGAKKELAKLDGTTAVPRSVIRRNSDTKDAVK